MAFALFYEDSDLRSMAIQLSRSDLPSTLKDNAADVWDGGFKNWQVPSGAPYDKTEGSAFIRATVVQGVQLSHFRDLLRAIAAAFPSDSQAQYMSSVADDLEAGGLGDNSAAQEPWSVG